MAMRTVAGQWLAANGGFTHERMAMWKDHKHAQTPFTAHIRKKLKHQTPKEFVEEHRHYSGAECVFVPYAIKGRPATVDFHGRNISAARYMALLTLGTPKELKHVVRHACGNGHLSCVNPAHLLWGTQAENRSDAAKHRHAKSEQEKINVLNGKL